MPHLQFEEQVQGETAVQHIAGLDEAGRGALAGPVVAGAVILPLNVPSALVHLSEVNDSKQLSAKKREKLYQLITQHVLAWGVGMVSASQIDQIGILPATRQAMATAVAQLSIIPNYLLIDGRVKLKQLNIPQQSIVRGDSQSLSIACASILAKVTRDRWMVDIAPQYPYYQFEQHKGYGTAKHMTALETFGACPIHRYSFAPIRQTLL